MPSDSNALDELRRIFPNFGDDAELALVYPISPEQKLELEHLTGRQLNSSQYDFFLETYSTESKK